MKRWKLAVWLCASVALPAPAPAVELEVTHWWTSPGEAAAVAGLAKAFDAGGDRWKDSPIAGSGAVAWPVITARILGGDPMGATRLTSGRDAEVLIEAGLLQDITDVAKAEGWRDIIRPISLLDACTVDGKVYCAPVSIESWQWLWLSNKAFADAGVPVPTNWDGFVAARGALEAAGKVPLAMGRQPWQAGGAFGVIAVAVGGPELWKKIVVDKDAVAARSPEMTKVFEQADIARQMSAASAVQDWTEATGMVIGGAAGGQIIGDRALGAFASAGKVAGTDYTCLPGLGVTKIVSTGGDAVYFPVSADPAVTAAQKRLASVIVSKTVQVAFNAKRGSLPVRGDVDMKVANDCTRQALESLAIGDILPDGTMTLSVDTRRQLDALLAAFWWTPSMTVADVQAKFAGIIDSAR